MSRLPLEPRYSHLLLAAAKRSGDGDAASYTYGCVEEMLTTVAMLSCLSDGGGLYVVPSTKTKGSNSNSSSSSSSTGDANHLRLLASRKHKNFSVSVGDLPTLLNVYQQWVHAMGSGGTQGTASREWAHSNFLSLKVLLRAQDIRSQLAQILGEMLFSHTVEILPQTTTPVNKNSKNSKNSKGQGQGKKVYVI